jgi:hypothetical protein
MVIMSEPEISEGTAEQQLITWAEFLTAKPPGKLNNINPDDLMITFEGANLLARTLMLFCDSQHCLKVCFFDTSDIVELQANNSHHRFLKYVCRHCGETSRLYAVTLIWKIPKLIAIKLGEWPPYGPQVPTRVNALIGNDRELYFNGRRSEALAMGIGALTYYRRVVENQKNRIIDQIIKVCTSLNAGTQVLAELEDAKREIRFTAAVDKIKAGIPQVLLINGQNPLTLLHGALSEGVHDKTDEECLEIAMSIRIVLSELAERMAVAVKDESELTSAVKNLLKFKRP